MKSFTTKYMTTIIDDIIKEVMKKQMIKPEEISLLSRMLNYVHQLPNQTNPVNGYVFLRTVAFEDLLVKAISGIQLIFNETGVRMNVFKSIRYTEDTEDSYSLLSVWEMTNDGTERSEGQCSMTELKEEVEAILHSDRSEFFICLPDQYFEITN